MTEKALLLRCRYKKQLSKKLLNHLKNRTKHFSFTHSFLNSLFMTVVSGQRISCTDWWGQKIIFFKNKQRNLEPIYNTCKRRVCRCHCRTGWVPISNRTGLYRHRSFPAFWKKYIVRAWTRKTAYDAKTETMKFANPLYFQVLRQDMWMLRLPLASKPEPAVKQPECYSNWIHDHFSFSTFFILLFQKL